MLKLLKLSINRNFSCDWFLNFNFLIVTVSSVLRLLNCVSSHCQDKTVNKVGYKRGEERIASLLVVLSYSSNKNYKTRVQPSKLKFFTRSPFGNQLFWFRETFLQIKSPAPKF